MSYTHFSELQPSRSNAAVTGLWKLTAGRALSLQPQQAGVLRIAQGAAWATLDVPHDGPGNASGDHLLQAGQDFVVRAGQHLVLEPSGTGAGSSVFFEWLPLANASTVFTEQDSRAVTQPWRDLGQALAMAGTALLRLGGGIVAYTGQRLGLRPAAQVSHCGG